MKAYWQPTTNTTRYFNETLPDTCSYNIYISNGTSTILWYDGGVGRGGTIVRVQRTITVEPYFLQINGRYENNQIIQGYDGSMY
jgi:hypothetical protein